MGCWSIFAILIAVGFVVMTIANAVQLFWPWMIAAVVICILLAVVVKLIRDSIAQLVVMGSAILAAGIAMFAYLPLHIATFVCFILVGVMLYAAGALVNKNEQIRKTAAIVSLQVLWLAPLTFTFYAYSFIDPGESVMPGVTALIGLGAAIWIGSEV